MEPTVQLTADQIRALSVGDEVMVALGSGRGTIRCVVTEAASTETGDFRFRLSPAWTLESHVLSWDQEG